MFPSSRTVLLEFKCGIKEARWRSTSGVLRTGWGIQMLAVHEKGGKADRWSLPAGLEDRQPAMQGACVHAVYCLRAVVMVMYPGAQSGACCVLGGWLNFFIFPLPCVLRKIVEGLLQVFSCGDVWWDLPFKKVSFGGFLERIDREISQGNKLECYCPQVSLWTGDSSCQNFHWSIKK